MVSNLLDEYVLNVLNKKTGTQSPSSTKYNVIKIREYEFMNRY